MPAMAKTEDPGSYDAIIIGSGLGGLMAGNHLAQQGHDVLMIEQHIVPGGCTHNFERKDFTFDASTHLINGCEPGGFIYERLQGVGAHERLEFTKLETLMHWTDESKELVVRLPVALEDYVATLAKLYPREEKGIREFYGRYGKFAEQLNGGGGTSDEERKALMAELADLRGKTAKEIVDRYVKDPDLIAMMTILTGFFGLCYDEVDAFIYVMADLGYRLDGEGAYYPVGGSGQMSKVLADLFVEKGGTLLLNRDVTQVTFSDGLADGIVARKRNGNELTAKARCIIANSDLTALVTDLCPEGTFPAEYVSRVTERVPCTSAVIAFAGLDIDVREHGVTDFEIYRAWGEPRTSELIHQISSSGDYSQLPTASVSVYSNVDPHCCPPGKSVISTLSFADPGLFDEALEGGKKRGAKYKALKEKISKQLIESMARALNIPDLESHIEVFELATPVTMKRYTRNRGGSFVGWSYTPDQGVLDGLPQESPVPNLFLCGQWVMPGGGVAPVIASGANAATLAATHLSK